MSCLKRIILGQLQLGPSGYDAEGADELVCGVISFLVYNSKDLKPLITVVVMADVITIIELVSRCVNRRIKYCVKRLIIRHLPADEKIFSG